MRRAPALLLLVALVGGLGAASVHGAQHATEWADAQDRHGDHHSGGDHARTPCADGEAHALGCAVCLGLGGAVVDRAAAGAVAEDAGEGLAATVALADARRASTPARGPPAVA